MNKNGEFRVLACNINYGHADDYLLDQPNGSDHYVFIHCRTPCWLLSEGQKVLAERGDVIIYSPQHAQFNQGLELPLINDWINFSGDNIEDGLARLEIPLNKKVSCPEHRWIEMSILEILHEIYSRDRFSQDLISLKMQVFFIELSRQLMGRHNVLLTEVERQHLKPFRLLRSEMMLKMGEPWSVSVMAQRVHLSRTRFSVLYAKIFGISPLKDLLEARLLHAKELLAEGNMSIANIAAECGFLNELYFYKAFKKAFSTTPRQYGRQGFDVKKTRSQQLLWHNVE